MSSPTCINVYVVLQPRALALDWAGPAEALRCANAALQAHGQPARFILHFIGPLPQVETSVGLEVCGIAPLPDPDTLRRADGTASWVLLLGQPGRRITVVDAATRTLLTWLARLPLAADQLELMTICAGSVLAGHAGLLDRRQVTTHHHHLDELRDVAPHADVVANRVFVLDTPVFSSAGVTCGIDLMLHRIGAVCGEAIAAQVAQTLVMPQRRGPEDPELSPFLAGRQHLHPALHRVQDAVSNQLLQTWNVQRMADVACVSPRHLARLFQQYAGMAPLDYLSRIRLAVAQQALAAGSSVTRAADAAGFTSDTQLRRAWRRLQLPGSPSATQATQATRTMQA